MPYAHAQENKRHVLIADHSKNEVSYTVDGRSLKPSEGILLALSRVRSADPSPRSEMLLLVDERSKLADVANLIGLVIKADYSSYRVFVFDADKRGMTELAYATPVQFSADGSVPSQKQ